MAKKSAKKQKERLFQEKLVPAKEGSGELFDVSYRDDDSPVECLGMRFENDASRREHFLTLLRNKLNDPEFRKIEGFPIGEDDEILALSDPPYYTACPNPFLDDVVSHLGQPYNSTADDYHREPFAADVSEGKNHPLYNAHSYHTKVPHKAIIRYILHYTSPGDIIFDGFCGTGMAGVAAAFSGDKSAIEELGYSIDENGVITDREGDVISHVGSRTAILNDVAPAATFISHHYNRSASSDHFKETLQEVLHDVKATHEWMYLTLHKPQSTQLETASECLRDAPETLRLDCPELPWGTINYTIWSDVFLCPECSNELVFWHAAMDINAGKVRDEFECQTCRALLTKRSVERALLTSLDEVTKTPMQIRKQVPVLMSYSYKGKRYEKQPDEFDIALTEAIENRSIDAWFPHDPLMFKGDQWGDTWRAGVHRGISHVHHFYTKRSLAVLASYRATGLDKWLPFSALTPRATRMHRIAASRIGGPKKGVGGATVGVISGTLYVPSVSVEMNVLEQATDRVKTVTKAISGCKDAFVTTQSTTDLHLPDSTVDYIFTDPPFGGNLMYSELNFLWESWLRVFTNNLQEAVVSDSQSKDLLAYQKLMTRCFAEYYRILKPGRWMTVEFHNSQNSVWAGIQEALQHAGFVVADVRTLDKKQHTIKQITAAGAVKQDLIISAYRPQIELEHRFELIAGTNDGVWEFVRNHLTQLPPFVSRNGQVEVVVERQDYLLYDRMVAFHVQRGVTVPMSAVDFYAGLRERFAERDNMFFLSDQAAVYDKKRVTSDAVVQLEFFVSDESSAIQWLRSELRKKPQTFAEIQPRFMKDATWRKYEKPLELLEILEQNFLCFDGEGDVPSQIHSYISTNFKELRKLAKDDVALVQKAKNRWYVADPRKEVDLEKLRHRALMREFQEYRGSKGRLRVVRMEALREGFKDCWQNADYVSIVEMATRVRDEIIQEDPALLMYYDNALMRTEE